MVKAFVLNIYFNLGFHGYFFVNMFSKHRLADRLDITNKCMQPKLREWYTTPHRKDHKQLLSAPAGGHNAGTETAHDFRPHPHPHPPTCSTANGKYTRRVK